jgi:thiol-disulfide isomerase/thioredoxin
MSSATSIEFDRLLKKHAQVTGLPVVVDFYSDSCGPCRMMAPIFKKVGEEFKDKVRLDAPFWPFVVPSLTSLSILALSRRRFLSRLIRIDNTN